ncbi:MOSC domain-containing protein [Candidatus Bathyarchaeota archaeon]|nr:MAG: MOSC domain-containing protein [Candidatus Bathyarchaeota archaeon]
MRIISVNVGSVRQLGRVRGKLVYSGFVKKPVSGEVKVGKLNLEGDRQADLTVHGGVDKAVYAYASEHYPFWVDKYPDMEMPWGSFGENLTTEGLLESEVHVGDRLGVGSAELAVTQPRFPCYKLGLRFGTQVILKTFLDSERSGYYLKVLREGMVKAGDPIRTLEVNETSPSITSMVQMIKRSG